MTETPVVSLADFRDLFGSISNWGRWGDHDEFGTLNHLGSAQAVFAATLVRDGKTVSLAHDLNTCPAPDNPKPALHYMTQRSDGEVSEPRVNTDFVGVDFHGKSVTHLDALCHCNFEGQLFNGVSSEQTVTSAGGSFASVMTSASGIVGRGVLVDVPRSRGVAYLEPATTIRAAELSRVMEEQSVRLRPGDLVFVRTGARRRRDELGAWDPHDFSAGLFPDAMSWLATNEAALLGGDGDSDTRPSPVEGVDSPIHALALTAMGMPLIDNVNLEDLAVTCAELGRWQFLCVLAPLRVPGGTGSPVNPVAVF